MTVFNGGVNQTPTTQTPSNVSLTYTDQLVGDGKKFQDTEALAKGKLEADQHISTLEDQIKILQSGQDKEQYAKQLIDQLEQSKAAALVNTASNAQVQTPQSNVNSPDQQPATTQPTGVSETDLRSLVENALSDAKSKELVTGNLKLVNDELTKKFGTEANVRIEEKAKSLNMTKEKLEAIAAESPQAFFTLIGEPVQVTRNPVVQGSINTDGAIPQLNSGVKNFNYYQDLRRKEPAKFKSTAMQTEYAAAAIAQGDAFYS